jgi:glycosyltransferase involved in cell wall biosynthesis
LQAIGQNVEMAKSTILVCGPPPTAVGGGPTHMRNLWASPLAQEFELVLFETGSRGRESPARDEPFRAMLVRVLAAPFALAWALLRHRPAVVHLNTSVDPRGFWREWLNLLVCRLFRARTAYQVHGGQLESLGTSAWSRAIVRAAFGWPDVVVLLASAEQPEFERLGSVRRTVVIPNAVDTRAFRAAGQREHSGHVRRLAYLSRLIPAKGIFECLEAVRLLREDPAFADLELHIAGSGPARDAIAERIAELGLGEGARLIGAIAGAETIAFLRESDVLLLATYHPEGLPYAILESLAAGTPVVTTRNGGIPDVVRDHEHGLFVEPRDPAAIAGALRELASSTERLRAMSHACTEWAERELGLERLARQFSTLYRELGA